MIMKDLTYEQRIAIMRILYDIIMADNRVDIREERLFSQVANELGLAPSVKEEVLTKNSLLALTKICTLTEEQKEAFAKMMGQMIVVDNDINYNEVEIYNVVVKFCDIQQDFEEELDADYTHS